MKKFFQDICDRLNSMLPCSDKDIPEVNDIINDLYKAGGELYFSRKIYIDNNFDDDKIHSLIHTDKIVFVVNEDMDEHPGITYKYKDELEEDGE